MLRRLLVGSFVLVASAIFAAGGAKADTIDNFTFTTGSQVYTWTLPASPVLTPGEFVDGSGFLVNNVPYKLDGVAQSPALFDFYSILMGGGFDLVLADGTLPLNEFGPQVYTGPESAPTFITDTFPFLDTDTGSTGTLTISPAVVSTPEPSALLLGSLGLLGLVVLGTRKKRAPGAQLAGAC